MSTPEDDSLCDAEESTNKITIETEEAENKITIKTGEAENPGVSSQVSEVENPGVSTQVLEVATASTDQEETVAKDEENAEKEDENVDDGGAVSGDDEDEEAEQGSEDKTLASLELYGLKPDLVDEHGKPKISRKLKNLLAKKRRQDLNGRSVVINGLKKGVTQEELQKFCETYGPVLKVFLRYRLSDNFFKGSAFVTFHNQADSEKLAAEDELTFSSYTITTEAKNGYLQSKKDENRKKKMERKAAREKERIRQEAEDDEELRKNIVQGTVMYLSGFQNKNTDLKDIKNFFRKYGNVRWVDFEPGDTEAWVRFTDEFEAVNVLETLEDENNGKIILHSDELEADILEGEDEFQYWKQSDISQEDAIKRRERKRDARMRNLDQKYWKWKQKQPRWW